MNQEANLDPNDHQEPKRKAPRASDHRKQKRPSRSDRIPMERQFERVPNIFLGDDRNLQIRRARQTFKSEDGSHGSMEFNIIPSPSAGDLTPDTRKAFVALQRMIVDRLAKADPDQPLPTRFDFKLREFARYLNPTGTRESAWGGKQIANIKRQIRKLQQVNFELRTEWYDAPTDTHNKVEDGFSIITHYHISEARKYKGGVEQPPLEMGFVDVLPMLVRNVSAGYTSPLLADVQNSIRSKFGRILYQHIDNRYAGVPDTSVYRRLLSKLFEDDFPELREKYPTPFKRKRLTERACKELRGAPITTGTITSAKVIQNKDQTDYLLEVRRKAHPHKEVEDETPEDLGAILISAPSKDQPPGYGSWISDVDSVETHCDSPEQLGEIISESLRFAHAQKPQGDDHALDAYIQEITAKTGDQNSTRNYRAILTDRMAFRSPDHAMTIIRKWLSEISQGEHDGIDGSVGKKLQTLYNQHCEALGIPPYHQRHSSSPAHA